ncbi:hypothetical protein LS73_006170 [Helicobacter muridarum]|uniref:Uncharacterized protein n=1 Tax=Helicobacter muridarum TaxID=216 RepID=A0A099U073_9HELI|nr:hypothetical protein [Helicobacter muridarum]TLE00015.1 hypothetical protein LS73_006170 [Helicobacter muridarum]STQ87090.1 Uncharacterised protein [Helicobacter muridarum]
MLHNNKKFLSTFKDKLVGTFIVASALFCISYANGGAMDYIKQEIRNTFIYDSKFDCKGNSHYAICNVKSYSLDDIVDDLVLDNFRYYVNYSDRLIVERLSGEFSIPMFDGNSQDFFPKMFDCKSTIVLKENKNILNEYLTCNFTNHIYALNLKLNTNTTLSSPVDRLTFSKKILNVFGGNFASSVNNVDNFDSRLYSFLDFFQDSDFNIQKAEISLAMQKHDIQKILYNYGMSDYSISTFLGNIYGIVVGSIYANDSLDDKTRDSLLKLTMNVRETFEVDSNVDKLIISISNKYGTSRALQRIIKKLQDSYIYSHGYNSSDLLEVFNNYRISSGLLHSRHVK